MKDDHFRVDADDDGVTSPEAAAAFLERYGDQPRSIRVLLPGDTAEDVLEGRWRMYGGRKLKRSCDGETCDVRRETGGWDEGLPCECARRGVAPTDKKHHCALIYTLQVILPDVRGVGVWQVSTGSEISVRQLTGDLRLLEQLRGRVGGIACALEVVPTDVAPDGRPTRVFTLRLRVTDHTPGELLAGASTPTPDGLPERVDVRALPAPADDDVRDDLLTSGQTAGGGESHVTAGGSGEQATGDAHTDAEPVALSDAVAAWCSTLKPRTAETRRVVAACRALGITPDSGAIADRFGEQARTLDGFLEAAEAAAGVLPSAEKTTASESATPCLPSSGVADTTGGGDA